jgi:SAM-dependent methyltransferase
LDFYVETLRALIKAGKIDPQAPTLVIAGGAKDRAALLEAGFVDVTISNLDVRMNGDEFAPYRWASVDGEEIPFADNAFANAIVHMGMHHCGSPHRALLEMYRVSTDSILAFENRDSWTMRTAVSLGLARSFELDAVRDNQFEFGGYRNTSIPNHVYRWTEREVEKTVWSADPAHAVEIDYFYHLRYPSDAAQWSSGLKRIAVRALKYPFLVYAALFPRQTNEFGFHINKKARKLHGWIDPASGGLLRTFAD